MCVCLYIQTHNAGEPRPEQNRTHARQSVIHWHGGCSFTQLLLFYTNNWKKCIKPEERWKNSFTAQAKANGHLLFKLIFQGTQVAEVTLAVTGLPILILGKCLMQESWGASPVQAALCAGSETLAEGSISRIPTASWHAGMTQMWNETNCCSIKDLISHSNGTMWVHHIL